MKHELLLLGKTKDRFLADGIKEYAARLCHYTTFSITTLKEKTKTRDQATVIDCEGRLLLQAVAPGALIVALDARGKQFSSEAFSEKIVSWEIQGMKQICYLIGGPDGHAPSVLQAADLLLSLSSMTFTHDMTRMILVEQLYRAYTIKAGEKYHK
ncbi:MAG: 23S rRNA (pseudouridine(1915)-N(3))-methyltransferase RlmH [Desulforhopalus sp.]|nr:23S rRNA (pseudouridine(1915)-N(3))-methyltransferase RlmH [Desulforhopalus sp.]